MRPRTDAFPRWVRLATAATLLAAAALRAQDASVGVPAYLTVNAVGCTVKGLVPGGSGAVAGINADSAGTYSAGSSTGGSASKFTGVLALQPNHVYTATVYPSPSATTTVSVVAPDGYSVMIAGVTQESYSFTSTAPSVQIPFAITPSSGFSGNAGDCTELSTGQVAWQLSLGHQLNGESAGVIALADLGTEPSWDISTVGTLYFMIPSTQGQEIASEFASESPPVFNSASPATAIRTDQALVELINQNGGMTIDFFPWSAVTINNAATWSYSLTGNPYLSYTISVTSGNTLQITKTDAAGNTYSTTLTRSGSGAPYAWSLQRWAKSPLVLETRTPNANGSADAYSETRTVAYAASPASAATYVTDSYASQPFGTMLAYSQAGSSNPEGSSNITYIGSGTGAGMVSAVSNLDGSWVSFSYTAPNSEVCALPATTMTPESGPGSGKLTTITYTNDEFGVPTMLYSNTASVNGSTVSTTNSGQGPSFGSISGNMANGEYLNTVSYSTSTPSGSALFSTTATYSSIIPQSGSTFLVGMPYAYTAPDHTKTCYAYQYGTGSQSGFTPANESSFPFTGSCTAVIHGRDGNAAGSATELTSFAYPGSSGISSQIDPIYVYDGGGTTPSSTMETTIRDSRGFVVRSELYAWHSSAWNLVSSTSYDYDDYGHLTSRTRNDGSGATYSANYGNGLLLQSDTDEMGVTTSYSYDTAGRVTSSSRPTPSGATLTTSYAYDADSRITGLTVSSSAGSEQLVKSLDYDDAGRLTSEKEPGVGTISYSYNVSGKARTAAFPDGGTRTEAWQNDGSPLSVSGSSVVPAFYSYSDPDSSGNITATVYSGSSTGTTARYTQLVQDGLGRTISKSRPGFAGQSAYTEAYAYDGDTTSGTDGKLLSVSRTGLPSINYGYDPLGNANLEGVGGLDPAGSTELTGTNQFLENVSGTWWAHVETQAYPSSGSATPVTTSVKRIRLNGFASNQLADETVTDMYGNVTETSVTVSGSTVTTTTSFPGLANPQAEVASYGLRQSVTSPAGLKTTYSYDGLDRLVSVTDPQGSQVSQSYVPGSTLVASEQDGAGNRTGYGYDSMGRRTIIENASGYVTDIAYDVLGRETGVTGSAVNPVSYGYDPVNGDRTTMSTSQNGGVLDTTTWTYDAASGLVSSKKDPLGNTVQYAYNSFGKLASRIWARRVTTTYYYDTANTGQLSDISYTDGTTPIHYSYCRFGGLRLVSDATGTRTFNADGGNPLQIDSETLPSSLYGGRILSAEYQQGAPGATANGGSFGGYSVSLVPGRPVGFNLGTASNPTQDLQQNRVISSLGQVVGVQTQAGSGSQRSFTYSYGGQNAGGGAYAGLPSGYSVSNSSFSVSYGYEAQRPLLTSVNSQWSGTSIARFDYTDTALGQRASAMMGGTAFGDYYSGMGYSHVYRANAYDGVGQLLSSAMYRGDAVNPNAGDLLPGHTFQYRYDSAGNRVSSGQTGSVSGGDDAYTTNADDQYTSKENNVVRVLGTCNPQALVSTSPSTTVGQLDRVFGASLVPSNTSGPQSGSVSVTGTIYGTTSNMSSPILTAPFLVGGSPQPLLYDEDGNLTSDGIWTYTYDAENRLASMVQTMPGINGMADSVSFVYDYLGRRVKKQVSNASGSTTRVYVYSGMALVAEINPDTGNVTRTYTWGVGGQGPLLELTNVNSDRSTQDYLASSDGNRNLVSLTNATSGALAAVYEYGPFGELVRSQAPDSAVADNPIRFSSEYSDVETGLVYYGARYYSPGLGRFLTRDPIEEMGGINLYGFCGNDPIGRFDVLGNSWLSKLWDRTILSLGKHIAQNWDHGRQYVEMAAAIVASIFVGPEVDAWAFSEIYFGTALSVEASLAAADVVAGAVGGFVAGASMSAMAGQNGGQILQAGLKGATSGAIMGGVSGYYGDSYPVSRIPATALASGAAYSATGGSFQRGFEIGGVQGLMAYGWNQMRNYTDEVGQNVASKDPRRWTYDRTGSLETAGDIPEEPGSSLFGATADKIFSPIENALDTKAPQGVPGTFFWQKPWFPTWLGGGGNGVIDQFVNEVSKVHDVLEGWNYDVANGAWIGRGAAFNTFYDIYSPIAMAPAAAYTMGALSSSTSYLAQRQGWHW